MKAQNGHELGRASGRRAPGPTGDTVHMARTMRTILAVAALGVRGLALLLKQLERQAQEQQSQLTPPAAPQSEKTAVMVVDDITGDTLPEDQGQTVRFGLDGQDYEIDLSAERAAEFREAVRSTSTPAVASDQPRRGRPAALQPPRQLDRRPRSATRPRSGNGRGPTAMRCPTVVASHPRCSRPTQPAAEASRRSAGFRMIGRDGCAVSHG